MLHYNTVNSLLKRTLLILMNANEFASFRLAGGTALSLQIGHRISVDIDLFTDAQYGSINFNVLEQFLRKNFHYLDYFSLENPALGMSFTVGDNKDDTIKLDIYYTDTFINPVYIYDTIRMATIEEIIAMKIDVVQRGGRKKDFWELHELMKIHTIKHMLQLHKQRYEYGHDQNLIVRQLTNFTTADDDFEPICLKGKYWEFIKEDIEDALSHEGLKT